MRRAIEFCDLVLRGFAQMFLASRARSGIIFLAALAVLSPWLALHSLIGAMLATATALCFRYGRALTKTGFVGVNGVLLGCAWYVFPEIPEWTKAAITAGGACAITILVIPLSRVLRARNSPIGLFSLPAVLAIWVCLTLVYGMGLSDARLRRGWRALQAGATADARAEFLSFESTTPRCEALRLTGLGWSNFRVGDFVGSMDAFSRASALNPQCADAHCGSGWSLLKVGEAVGAEKEFNACLALEASSIDGWDGLGWTLLEFGKSDDAVRAFNSAQQVAPFLKDAALGKKFCAMRGRNLNEAVAMDSYASAIDRFVPIDFQRVTTRQLACWLLFVLGIAVHSWRTLLAAVGGTIAFVYAASFIPVMGAAIKDVEFYYNLVPLYAAFGGQYLLWNKWTLVWSILMGTMIALVWQLVAGWVHASGLPMSSLLFNAALIMSLALFSRVKAYCQVVPLEIAATTPEQVWLWRRKCGIAAEAWKALDEVSVRP